MDCWRGAEYIWASTENTTLLPRTRNVLSVGKKRGFTTNTGNVTLFQQPDNFWWYKVPEKHSYPPGQTQVLTAKWNQSAKWLNDPLTPCIGSMINWPTNGWSGIDATAQLQTFCPTLGWKHKRCVTCSKRGHGFWEEQTRDGGGRRLFSFSTLLFTVTRKQVAGRRPKQFKNHLVWSLYVGSCQETWDDSGLFLPSCSPHWI